MKKLFSALLIVAVLASFLGIWQIVQASPMPWGSLSAAPEKISASLQAAINALQPGDMLTVIVTLKDQANLSAPGLQTPQARQQAAIQKLQALARASQQAIASFLAVSQGQGKVARVTPFWIFNGLSVTASAAVIQELAARPDVASITPDATDIIPVGSPALAAPAANLSVINAPALWSLGDYGQGVVVANMDTGVDISHPELAAHYRGGGNSWFDPYGQHPTTPTDLNGHGTWTMGVMVGGDASGETLGVASQAQWIAVKIFNDNGLATATAIHQGFQWLLDPDGNPATADAPQVVNNSWAYGSIGCNLSFQNDLRALRAVGILPVFAAGNFGPGSNSSTSPANNPEAFAVGAVDNGGSLYAYSSRGPSACGEAATIFPELVAPGVNITTTDLYGLYNTGATGTSLSAPHVAGGLALLLQAFPGLNVESQAAALTNAGVDLGTSGPDNNFGYGFLDVAAAYNWLAAGYRVTPTPLPTATATLPPLPTATSTPLPTATATLLPTATQTPAATASPTPVPATSMHIGDLDRSVVLNSRSWNASVTILIHNNLEQAVAGVTVNGKWTNGVTGTASCVTNASGICSLTKSGLKNTTTSVTFTVTGAANSTLTYNSTANHDPDSDSNGTVIIIQKK